ncbi:hypothetical protein [Nocardia salmonicida]|uniref:hypothetical protein n=1 Tax=Nocardia salmonicida TaxID=53431 RepID=UPI0007A50FD1|nr:hypothetical protein [Nocardia salmonicida]
MQFIEQAQCGFGSREIALRMSSRAVLGKAALQCTRRKREYRSDGRYGNERVRNVSAIWDSEDNPGTVCVLFDQLTLGDTFWPEEYFVRKASTEPW